LFFSGADSEILLSSGHLLDFLAHNESDDSRATEKQKK